MSRTQELKDRAEGYRAAAAIARAISALGVLGCAIGFAVSAHNARENFEEAIEQSNAAFLDSFRSAASDPSATLICNVGVGNNAESFYLAARNPNDSGTNLVLVRNGEAYSVTSASMVDADIFSEWGMRLSEEDLQLAGSVRAQAQTGDYGCVSNASGYPNSRAWQARDPS